MVIDEEHFKVVEECAVVYTRGGNLKRMSQKALQKGAEAGDIEDRNLPAVVIETNTDEKLRVFTDKGNLYALPVSSIREWKYKDTGNTINSLIAGFEKDESVLAILKPGSGQQLLTVSSSGLVKLTDMAEFDTKKSKVMACGLKENDRLILAEPLDSELPNLLLITRNGMSIRFLSQEISVQGRTAKGVGGIKLTAGDSVIYACQTGDDGNVLVFSDAGFGKQSRLSEYEVQGRNGKGLKTYLWAKGNGKHLVSAFVEKSPSAYRLTTASGQTFDLASADIPLEARYAKGAVLVSVFLGDTLNIVSKI